MPHLFMSLALMSLVAPQETAVPEIVRSGHWLEVRGDLSKEDTFVAERFAKAGVRTIGVHGHRYFGKWGGLERGFAELDMSASPPVGAKWASDTTVTSKALTDAAIASASEPTMMNGVRAVSANDLTRAEALSASIPSISTAVARTPRSSPTRTNIALLMASSTSPSTMRKPAMPLATWS